MISRLQLTAVVFCIAFFTLNGAFGQGAGIGVDVTGVDGRPAQAAEIRVDRQDKKAATLTGKTDGRGHFAANLEAGTYKLIAKVVGAKFRVQASQIIQPQGRKPLQVMVDMRKPSTPNITVNRLVWVSSPTGTRMGGEWVPVDDKGQFSGASNVETYGGPTERLQHAPTNTMGTGR